MKRQELILLLLSGCLVVCGLQSDQVIRRFHLVSEAKSWLDALKYCREQYTDLANIQSPVYNVEAQQAAGSGKTWTGLFRSNWEWSHLDPVWSTGSKNWALNEPGTGQCTAISELKSRSYRDCADQLQFVCYSGATNRHILVQNPMSWSDAQYYCRERYTDLSTDNSEEDKAEIASLLASKTSDVFTLNASKPSNSSSSVAWIGFYKHSWAWSDGSGASYQWFSPLDTSVGEDCVTIDKSTGYWFSRQCEDSYPFLCYQEFKPRVLWSVKVQLRAGSADLNDPMVQASILQQMREKLLERGITEEVTLRWTTQPDGKVFHREEERAPPADYEKEDCGTL